MTTLLFCLIMLAAAAAAVWSGLAFWKRRASRAAAAAYAVTLGAFLLLFWIAETAIGRQVLGPAALFSFFSDGAPRSGKAAVFLICLVLCLFIGLTEYGERARARLNAAARKNGALWLVSIAVTALFFLWAMRVTVVSFMTNDDTAILKTLAAVAENGLGAAAHSFTSVVFCAMLGAFYRIDPNGWWYAGYHLAVIFCSCAVIGRCVLLKTRRRGWSVLCGCLIHLVLCAGVFLPALAQLSFTVTPAAAGSAAIALVLCRDEISSAAGRAASDIGTAVLMLLCYMQRVDAGKALLCFLALAFAYQAVKILLRREDAWIKRLLGLGAAALAALLLIFACGAADDALRTPDPDYYSAEHYRSAVMDYLTDELTADELSEAGIPPELGNLLLRQWYFMDERIDTVTFYRILEIHDASLAGDAAADAPLPTLADRASALLDSFIDEPETIRPMLYLSGAAAALALLSVVMLLRFGKKYLLDFLCGMAAFGGAILLWLYLMQQGRFLYRVFLVIEIPAAVMLTLAVLSAPDGASPPAKKRAVGTAIPAAALGLTVCVLFGAVVCRVPYASEYADRETVFYAQRQTEDYANGHPDLLFVTNLTEQNLDPFHGGVYPANMQLWGEPGTTASDDRLYADAFFRGDVRFMCRLPGSVMLLLQYLTLDYGPVAALDEAHPTDNIYVYDLRQIAPDGDYTGWYEWNGLRYYFQNGQALAGTQIIDGVEYEFAPAGAASPMIVLPTGDGTYYTTTACSLAAQ